LCRLGAEYIRTVRKATTSEEKSDGLSATELAFLTPRSRHTPNLRLQVNQILGKAKLILPAHYILGAVPVWFAFSQANPDGLANLWLVIYTFPVVAIGSFFLKLRFPYVPGGYYEAYALYFCVSVIFSAASQFLVCQGLQKITKRKPSFKRDV
jgi:hypothetical protein